MSILLLFALLLIILQIGEPSLDIIVHNKEVLMNSELNMSLLIEIIFDEGFVSINDIRTSNICFLINGEVCHCFEEEYGVLHTFLPIGCVQKNWQNEWFSVQLTTQPIGYSEKRVLRSLPLFIENSLSLQHKQNATTVTTINTSHLLTLILPLTVDDLSRAAILFQSLRQIPVQTVFELLVIIPDYGANTTIFDTMQDSILSMTKECNFATVVYRESILFSRSMDDIHAYPYALQMGIKLLAATVIRTHFYMTLDADVVLLSPFQLSDVIETSSRDLISRAIYENESRDVHSHWWSGSETFLNLSSNTVSTGSNDKGFGVTPAILSTYGSLLVLDMIYNRCDYVNGSAKETQSGSSTIHTSSAFKDDEINIDGMSFRLHENYSYNRSPIAEAKWLDEFGRNGVVWSEYTLYRIVLDYYEVFDGLHVDQSKRQIVDEANQRMLHCGDVWYAAQLPWKLTTEMRENCLFSVIQSSTGVLPSVILDELQLL